jgi:phytoene synthase
MVTGKAAEDELEQLTRVFRKGSVTYFYSSRFFPPRVRRDVTRLYAFVRVADDYVDSVPQRVEEFFAFKDEFYAARDRGWSRNAVVDSFVRLERELGFDGSWADSFLKSMEMDVYKRRYETLEELMEYMYGSAEVIGLMMSKILGLREEAYEHARLLGRSMQFLNFLRDVREDLYLGRQYIPTEFLREYGLESLEEEEVFSKKESFVGLMRYCLRLYFEWNEEAERGFRFIPARYLIPIKTANDMYKWTAKVIYEDPLVVYRVKVRPRKERVYLRAIANSVGVGVWRSFRAI